MNDDETLEEAVHSWFAEYFAEGRSKQQLSSYLRAMPDAAPILIDEIIEHLENPRKEFLGKRNNFGKEIRDEEILHIFKYGPRHPILDLDQPKPKIGWDDKKI